jgi:cytochrome c5
LTQHAIEGYTGAAGYMPAKGGRTDLSDEEIAAAVEYMAGESQ